MKDDRLYLIHIKEAIERIEEYTQDGEDSFFDDRKTQDAFSAIYTHWQSPHNVSQKI